jgi:2-pyrone-4,6-dicarboxylate lactonase
MLCIEVIIAGRAISGQAEPEGAHAMNEQVHDAAAGHNPDAGLAPVFPAPPHACDAHFHVFGPPERYPYDASDLRYKPPYAPLKAYVKTARRIGFERFVFVQPSAYGMDNSCMLDAMRLLEPKLRRGIVHLDESVTDAMLAEWDALGIRGIRVNISPVRRPEAGLADVLRRRIVRYADIAREIGWHLDFLTPGWLTSELMPTLRTLPVAFTVAHMGLFPAADGVGQRGFQDLLALAGDGSKRCWVKLTGIYRFSKDPTFADVAPFAQVLIAAAPDQVIWGSDFPHLSFHDRVGTIQLYNQLATWADAPQCQRILADNPARLFGFD